VPLLLVAVVTGGVLGRDQLQPYLQPVLAQASEWVPFLTAKERRLEGLITETVKRGPFRITVTERGTLDSLKNAIIASKVEGSATIISIVPEGSHVKEGDLICELDSSTLTEKETQQQISVTQAKSNLQSAMEAVEIQKTQNESDIAAAQLKLDLAILDLEKFKEGDSKQQWSELDSQVKLAKQKVAQAEETYNFTSRLVKKGYKTQNELESARITLQTETIGRDIALGKLDLLEKFDAKRTQTELEANAKEFARELERVKRKASAALTQAEADLSAKRLTFEVETSQHNRMKDQIAACKIHATQDGQVIYANSRDGRSSDQVLIEEGANVRERQPIVNLPDLSEMKVNARIHESRISMIQAGLAANVKVDAFADRAFPGRVETVSSVPSSTGSFMTRDLKEYEAVVRLLGDAGDVSKLRPGLTAEIEVLVSSRDEVLQAPIQSVLTVVGRQIAFVIVDNKAELRKVKVGQTNDQMIEILEGLDEGATVVMNSRRQFDREIKALETELIKEQAVQAAAEAANPKQPPTPKPPLEGAPAPRADGPPRGGPRPGSEGGGGPPRDPLAFFSRLDSDGDGKLAEGDLLGPLKGQMANMDKDKDGFISKDEFTAGFAARPRGGPTNGPPPEQAGGG